MHFSSTNHSRWTDWLTVWTVVQVQQLTLFCSCLISTSGTPSRFIGNAGGDGSQSRVWRPNKVHRNNKHSTRGPVMLKTWSPAAQSGWHACQLDWWEKFDSPLQRQLQLACVRSSMLPGELSHTANLFFQPVMFCSNSAEVLKWWIPQSSKFPIRRLLIRCSPPLCSCRRLAKHEKIFWTAASSFQNRP